ncbi:MAG: hypothetical protein PHV34_15900 [Verrucomicrobiae bacterium]|nr:hypothetical protein [Verrucomicrobiae bacterium]
MQDNDYQFFRWRLMNLRSGANMKLFCLTTAIILLCGVFAHADSVGTPPTLSPLGTGTPGKVFIEAAPSATQGFDADGGEARTPSDPAPCGEWKKDGNPTYVWMYSGLTGTPASGSEGGNHLDLTCDTPCKTSVKVHLVQKWKDESPSPVTTTTNSPYSNDVILYVFKLELITPAGNPVNAAVQSGDGQNEFTFSSANPGVLTMNLKAKAEPSGVATEIKDRVYFIVDGIGNSTKAWDAANPGGRSTPSGDNLIATVRFTGLPANNSDFGSKKCSLYFDSGKVSEKSYEVFFSKSATNHPGGGSPNWFYYWGQAIGSDGIIYSTGNMLYGECPSMLRWSYLSSQNKDIVIIYDLAATSDSGEANADHGKKATTGIDTFEDTYQHERHHRVQIGQADNVVGITAKTPWRHGWSWNAANHNHWAKGPDAQPGAAGIDDDGNGKTDDLIVSGPGELGKGDDVLLDLGFDWPIAFGPLPPVPWAGGGPIEDQAYNHEPDNENHRASVDWGDPGKQHKTLNKYDD